MVDTTSNKGPYWDITVVSAFDTLNVEFRPGIKYRIAQKVYDAIHTQCATAVKISTE
jgi:uncharacterized protein YgiM (DUF1202 family)